MSYRKKERTKDWASKAKIVSDCIERCRKRENFAKAFYKNLFYLRPGTDKYFKDTNWKDQERLLSFSLEHISHYFDGQDPGDFHRQQILRISETHSKKNMNIHPHDYYYWIDAMILTFKGLDEQWYDDMEYYLRECLFLPVSFIISRYYS